MHQERRRAIAAGAMLLLAVALIGAFAQCSGAQALEVTYYYLPG